MELTKEQQRLKQSGLVFRDRVARLDPDVQNVLFGHLYSALLWRGWDRKTPSNAVREVKAIGDLLAANGCDVEEYT